MTREEILAMAKEAGIDYWWDSGNEEQETLQDHLEHFAALVAAHEREECAKVCDKAMQEKFAEAKNPVRTSFGQDLAKVAGCTAFNLAKDIRARSEK